MANDDLKKLFFKIAISNEIELEFVTLKEVVNLEYNNSINYMVIFENIDDVIKYVKLNGRIDNLIVSNIRYGGEKVKIYEGVFLNERDIEQIKFLKNDCNIKIVYKTIPN